MLIKCIKDVVMDSTEDIAFCEGKIYKMIIDESGVGRAKRNEQGNTCHIIKRKTSRDGWFNNHFVNVKEMNDNYIQSLNEYQKLSKRTMNTDQSYAEQLSNYSLGLAGESGEVCDLIKKALFHGHNLDRESLKMELGDVLFYLSAIATKEGLTLEEIANVNIEKLLKRYPDGFSQERSINREEEK